MENGYLVMASDIMQKLENGDITLNEAVVLAMITSFTRDNKSFYMSNKALAGKLNLSVRTIQVIMQSLREKGYINIEINNNSYRIVTLLTQQNLQGGMQNLQGGMQNLHTINTEINTSSSSFTSSKVEDKDNKQEEEDFLSKCKEIDSVSPESSHQALYKQAIKRNIALDEALKVLDNTIKAGKRSPANFLLTCLRNDDKLPLIALSQSQSSPTTTTRRQIPTTLSPSLEQIKQSIEAKKQERLAVAE